MFFGHIVDNIRRAKALFVILELACSIWFMIMGQSFFRDYNQSSLDVFNVPTVSDVYGKRHVVIKALLN
jgi:hypothetical protein